MNVREVLGKAAEKYLDKPAIIFKDSFVSFQELEGFTFKLASALHNTGIKKGDKIAIYLPNCPEYIYSYLALFCLGAVVVPLDYMLTEEELVTCLAHSGAKLLIAKEKEAISLVNLKNKVLLSEIITLTAGENNFRSFAELLREGKPEIIDVKIDEGSPCLIMYTSGTTGAPKGILLNYRHLGGSPKAMEYFVDLSEKDVKLSALPLSHSGGLVYIQNCFYFGITLVLMERFQPLEFLKNIQKYKVTCFHLVPSMYYAILHLKEFESFDLSSLRWVVVFGAPSDPNSLSRFQQYCSRAHLLNGWGLTETCPPNTVIPLGSKNIESVGLPAPWVKIKISGDNGQELAMGSVGEVLISGWVVMDGYYKDSVMTNEVLKDGWFHTGDLGRFDAEGFLYIVGRKKDMIKVSGEIVYPFEVENALLRHPLIAEAAVVGEPDKLRGEIVKAVIVFKKGLSAPGDEIRSYCREHLAHFKVPHTVEIRESLSKTPSGKIQKEKLKSGLE